MDIKMRTLKGDTDTVCKVCGATRKDSLEMFEIMFTEKAKITICDLCNEKLLSKTLKASCNVNSKLKDKADMRVIRKRSINKMRNIEKGIDSI